MRRNVVGAILITILAIGAISAIGYGLWQTGYQQGLVDNGAEVIVNSHGPVGPVGPGWHGGWGWGFFGLFRILFLVLIIGLIARLFFGPRRWGWGESGPPHRYGPWGDRDAMEARLSDWHRHAHGDGPSDRPEQSRE